MAKLNMLKQMGKKTITKGYRDDTLFDFDVKRERLHLTNGQDTGMDALYRGDTGKYLYAVSPKYHLT